MSEHSHVTSITLAHINDTHSYFEPTSLQLHLTLQKEKLSPYVSAGGFARIATRVAELRERALQRDQDFVFLHAGDSFQGTLYFSLFKGRANAELLNALNIDAMALGNHELDMGNEPVAEFAHAINFPLLAGNWDLCDEDKDKPVKLKENKNVYSYQRDTQCARWIVKGSIGHPVAIFGISLDKMSDIANPDDDTPFINAIEVARNTVAAIKASGVHSIIVLSHLGYRQDLQLAEEVDGIGVIVGGHSHVLQGDFSDLGLEKNDDYGYKVGDTYVVQSGCHALALGHCQIDFATDGRVISLQGQNEILVGRRVFMDASLGSEYDTRRYDESRAILAQHPYVVTCPKHPTIQTILHDNYLPQVRERQKQVVAQLDSPLRHVRVPDQHGPSELGPLVAQGFYESMLADGYPVDFALHNAGGIRASIPAGPLTVADIVGNILPFVIPLAVYKITGAILAQVLEGAINNALNNGVDGTGTGSYPYLYNCRFDYQEDAPLGERIQQLEIYRYGEWQAADPNEIYCGVSSSYTVKGKEGYDAFLCMTQPAVHSSQSMADTFLSFMSRYSNRDSNAVAVPSSQSN